MLSLSQKKMLFSWRATGVCITDFKWDPFSDGYLVVSYKNGQIVLYDTNRDSIEEFKVRTFDKISGGVSCLAMIDDEPGNFVTGDHRTGVLRKWNISDSKPLEIIRVSTSGIKECASIAGTKQLALGFIDGSVAIFDFPMKKTVHSTPKGSTETIFDIAFCKTDPFIFATSSFDGSVKIWNIESMQCVDQFNLGVVVYSVAWHPHKKILAAALGDGYVVTLDVKTRQTTMRLKLHDDIIYKVSWNPLDSSMIASSSRDGNVVVFQESGNLVCKLRHPKPVFGIDWSIHEKNLLATGCHDFNVRLFNLSIDVKNPTKVLSGHTAEVFNVCWNPVKPGILVSGSNDSTLRVWDTHSGSHTVLRGHTDKVRALAWNHEIPSIVMSGSWDGTVRIWDVGTGDCVSMVNDHHADVYGLDSHPQRPFVFVSTSKDTTVRIWGMRNLVESTLLQSLLRKSFSGIIEGEGSCESNDGSMKLLSGQHSKIVDKRIQASENNFEKYASIFEFFCPIASVRDLWELVNVGLTQRLPSVRSTTLSHSAFLTSLIESRATELTVQAKKQRNRIGDRKTSDILSEAANLFLLVGRTRSYCDILIEIGDWERAIAIAPNVSKEYWMDLCNRYANLLAEQGGEQAIPYLIASNQIDKAIHLLTYRQQIDEAIVVARRQAERGFNKADDLNAERASRKNIAPISPAFDMPISMELARITELKAARFMQDSDPIRAACCFLSINNVFQAIRMLLKGNEHFLAYSLSQVFNTHQSDEIHAVMASYCAKYNQWDSAVEFIQQIRDRDRVLKIITQLSPSEKEIDSLYIRCGFQKPTFYLNEISTAEPVTTIESIRCCVLAKDYKRAAHFSIRLLRAEFEEETWDWEKIHQCATMMNCINLEDLKATLRMELLMFVNFVGGHEAIWRGFYVVAPCMFENVERLSQKLQFPASRDYVAWMKCLAYSKFNRIESLRCIEHELVKVRDPETMQCLKNLKNAIYSDAAGGHVANVAMQTNLVIPTASNLPTRSLDGGRVRSFVSKRETLAPLFLLEDKKTYISLAEAIMWSTVNSFSPLLTGAKINPLL